jgi:hypothetical protein
MSDMDSPMATPSRAEKIAPGNAAAGDAPHIASRRTMLALGAASATVAFSIKPAFAQTAVSVLNCEIPIPGPADAHLHVAADGSLVPAGTQGAFPGAGHPFKGEDIRRALNGGSLPGTTYEQNQAYIKYVRRLRSGQSGFTCFASIQMPH